MPPQMKLELYGCENSSYVNTLKHLSIWLGLYWWHQDLLAKTVKPPTTSKSQTTWNVLRFLWWPVFLSKKMWPPTEDEGGDCWRQCGPTGSQRNITIQVPFAFGGGESWKISQFVEYQLRGYILPKLGELFVSVFPSPLEFTQWLLCRIWKTRRNQGCELDLKRYLKVMFTTTKTYHLQLLQKCGAGTTGPVSVKSYLEVTLISTWQIFSLSWRRGLSAWGWSQHIYFG